MHQPARKVCTAVFTLPKVAHCMHVLPTFVVDRVRVPESYSSEVVDLQKRIDNFKVCQWSDSEGAFHH